MNERYAVPTSGVPTRFTTKDVAQPDGPPVLAVLVGTTAKNLDTALGLIDQLDDAILGPGPGACGEPKPGPGGIVGVASGCDAASAALCDRLRTLLARVQG